MILRLALFAGFCLISLRVAAVPPDPADDPLLQARVNDLMGMLHSQQDSAEEWEYGWGAFDAGTMAWSAAQAAGENGRKDRNADIVQATESLIGLADLFFRPLPALHADTICRDPLLSKQQLVQCLEAREAMLKLSAERAHEPYEWLPHLGNLGFNVAAGLITWKVSDTRNALVTAIPGEIIGETQLWTTPGQPIADKERYQLHFGPLIQQTQGTPIPEAGVMALFQF